MSSQSDLNTQVEAHLRAIWKGSSMVQPVWTPEQVQARAMRFEAHARRLALGDLVSFLLIPAIILSTPLFVDVRALVQQPYGRIQVAGAVLLILCSAVGLLASRLSYSAVTSTPTPCWPHIWNGSRGCVTGTCRHHGEQVCTCPEWHWS